VSAKKIASPEDPALDLLCLDLSSRAGAVDTGGRWPAEQMEALRRAGVFAWFVPERWGGQGWDESDLLRGYLRLGSACLTTAFILTQWNAACRRFLSSANETLRDEVAPKLAAGSVFATVAISHLSTSRRHVARPVLRAEESAGGFVIDGYSPWVTGGPSADFIVTGATLPGGRQILIAAPRGLGGMRVAEPARLAALTASETGEVHFDRALIDRRLLLAGPAEDVMAHGAGGRTGGLETSTLAIALAGAATSFLAEESRKRPLLEETAAALAAEKKELENGLLALAGGGQEAGAAAQDLRARANSLVLRATQAALAAAKGTGYLEGHPAGRWCREALFFLVWSCPEAVLERNLRELAGLSST